MTRKNIGVAVSLVALLPLLAAFAGGWATITVESLPDYLVARQPTNLTFSVRQHGMRLLDSVEPVVEARSGGAQYTAKAVPTNRPGYYTALLNLPSTGDWTITIKSGWGTSQVTLMPIAAVSSVGTTPVSFSDAERGQRLFVAKGCLSCHEHARVAKSGTYAIGPNLTNRGLANEYLTRFLADPSIKTSWTDANRRMPNLGLNQAEIAALIAFLNDHAPPRQVKAAR